MDTENRHLKEFLDLYHKDDELMESKKSGFVNCPMGLFRARIDLEKTQNANRPQVVTTGVITLYAPEATQCYIFPDGVRKEMTIITVHNGAVTRGWFATHKEWVAVRTKTIGSLSFDLGGYYSFCMKFGEPFHCKIHKVRPTRHPNFHMITEEETLWLQSIENLDDPDGWPMLTYTKVDSRVNPNPSEDADPDQRVVLPPSLKNERVQTMSMPMNKFLEDFVPFGTTFMVRAVGDTPKWTRRGLFPTLRLSTLLKIKFRFRALHMRCEAKKFAPGGLGAQRAQVAFEKRAREEEDVKSLLDAVDVLTKRARELKHPQAIAVLKAVSTAMDRAWVVQEAWSSEA